MNKKYAFTLLLAGGLLFVAAPAFAQDDGTVTDAETDDMSKAHPCHGEGGAGVAQVADLSSNEIDERNRSQSVDVDEDDVLLAIALRNNGAGEITWNDIRDVTLEKTTRMVWSQETDLDRDDVFSALALGIDAESGSMEALACVADVSRSHEETTTYTRTVDLDEDNVLLAIALANGGDTELVFGDIADIDENFRRESSQDQTVDIEREDTFLALALGAGGDDGGSGEGSE